MIDAKDICEGRFVGWLRHRGETGKWQIFCVEASRDFCRLKLVRERIRRPDWWNWATVVTDGRLPDWDGARVELSWLDDDSDGVEQDDTSFAEESLMDPGQVLNVMRDVLLEHMQEGLPQYQVQSAVFIVRGSGQIIGTEEVINGNASPSGLRLTMRSGDEYALSLDYCWETEQEEED